MRIAYRALMVAAAVACGSGDGDKRRHLLDSDPARRFVGTWRITMTADSTTVTLRSRRAPSLITGTMVFVLDHSGPASTAALDGVTHEGAYDLDVSPFGFSTHASDGPSVAVARLAASTRPRRPETSGDSLWIVLNPGSDRFPLRMHGIFAGDSVVGSWSAYAFSAGGGTGHFVMHRQSAPADSSH